MQTRTAYRGRGGARIMSQRSRADLPRRPTSQSPTPHSPLNVPSTPPALGDVTHFRATKLCALSALTTSTPQLPAATLACLSQPVACTTCTLLAWHNFVPRHPAPPSCFAPCAVTAGVLRAALTAGLPGRTWHFGRCASVAASPYRTAFPERVLCVLLSRNPHIHIARCARATGAARRSAPMLPGCSSNRPRVRSCASNRLEEERRLLAQLPPSRTCSVPSCCSFSAPLPELSICCVPRHSRVRMGAGR